jgi:ribosomal protein L37AE/L43A
MSRCSHDKSDYKLRQLPKCPKCKAQFALVMVQYSDSPRPVYEWECFRCMKTYPREAFSEEPLSEEDKLLKDLIENENERTRKSHRRASRRN